MPDAPLKIALAGATGRMGRLIAGEVAGDATAEIVAASGSPNNANIGADLGRIIGGANLGVTLGDKLEASQLSDAQVIIDFSSRAASVTHARLAAKNRTPLMLGVTGHDSKQENEIASLAKTIPIAWCANTSTGITILTFLAEKAVQTLPPAKWDIAISEAHHKNKIDAPSGTAIVLGDAIVRAGGMDLLKRAIDNREERHADADFKVTHKGIEFGVTRKGDVVGDHRVVFFGESEQLDLTHRAHDRAVFAKGALVAAKWIADPARQPGIYTMSDVLGLGRD